MLICMVPASGLAVMPYSQDFEGLSQPDMDALANDGWLVFANVFGPDWSYWYGYGPFPAPNDGFGFCAIAVGECGAENVGETWAFDFQAKLGNLEFGSTAAAFIKTLDPNNGWALTNFITLDMTFTPTTWSDYSMELLIDPSLAGQIFQFGFMNVATNYEGSCVFYDNINFDGSGATSTEATSWS